MTLKQRDMFISVNPFKCACNSINLDGPYYRSLTNSLVTICDDILNTKN